METAEPRATRMAYRSYRQTALRHRDSSPCRRGRHPTEIGTSSPELAKRQYEVGISCFVGTASNPDELDPYE